jgi:hypothetical protein
VKTRTDVGQVLILLIVTRCKHEGNRGNRDLEKKKEIKSSQDTWSSCVIYNVDGDISR